MIKKLWDIYKKYQEVIDYLFWGAAAFFLYMIISWIFIDILGMDEKVATFIDNIIVIIFAFFTNKLFVFRSKTDSWKAFWKEFAEFFTARIFTMILSIVMVWLGCDVMGFDAQSKHFPVVSDAMVVQLITQVVVIVANYILSKLWIFKKNDADANKQAVEE